MKKTAVGIDIGGTNTLIAIAEEDGNILAISNFSTQDYSNAKNFTDALTCEIQKLVTKTNSQSTLQGIGIGAPNANYYTGNIENPPNLNWVGVTPLAKWISQKFNLPTVLTNDANAAAMGEMFYGNAKGMQNFIFITLGTGLGSGIVVDGKMVYGCNGFAGEMGHVIVEKNGRLCGCNRRGCLETYVSATGIVRTAKESLVSNINSSLKKYNSQNITAKVIYTEAKNGDRFALKIFDQTAEILGLALANVMAYTAPEAIFIAGGLAKSRDILFPMIEKYTQKYTLDIYKNNVKILPSALDDNHASVLGAAALIFKKQKK